MFGIQTGIAITFLVKRARSSGCRVYYARRPQLEIADEKLAFLGSTALSSIAFEELQPDLNGDWINISDSDFASLLPTADKDTKAALVKSSERAIFRLYTLGINSGRDEWVFDIDPKNLRAKINFLTKFYGEELRRLPAQAKRDDIDKFVRTDIKWTTELKSSLARREQIEVSENEYVTAVYRPFVKLSYCFNRKLTKRVFRIPSAQPTGHEKNLYILIPAHGATKRIPFCALATNQIPDLNFFTPDPAHAIIRYRYERSSEPIDNITDWSLQQFSDHYAAEGIAVSLKKDDIFHYVYGVLYDPAYREKYALDLKHEFPRIPFYRDFSRWKEWGRQLMNLHIGFETIEPWPLSRHDTPDDKSRKAGLQPKAFLRINKGAGLIQLDSETQLTSVPAEAWEFRLGNRSALEWILDQHKEKTPKDPTIRDKFNAYRFANHKEKVIDLLMRVTTVSVKTQRIVEEMRQSVKSR